MYDRYELIKEGPDGLSRQIFGFTLNGFKLVFSEYFEDTRPTKRHKWTQQKYWSRIRSRSVTIELDQVPLTEEVKAEALEEARSKIHVTMDF